MEKSVRLLRKLMLAAVAVTAFPAVSNAQVVSAAYRPMSKTAAILGGASALDAIRMQQIGTSPAAALLQPAVAPRYAAVVRTPANRDRPDIFGSVALSIGKSPLDARFRAASAGPVGAAASFASHLQGEGATARIEAVNAYVNGRVRFVDDSVQFGVADRWMSVNETLSRGRGDCEDFALAKRALLRAAGFADRDLYLVVLKDLTRRADHAVLVVRANDRFLVLDNGTNRIVDSEDVRDYKPVFTFAAGKVWTHGYRREQALPPVILATAPAQPTQQVAEAMLIPASGAAFPEEPVTIETSSLVPAILTL